MSTTTPRGTGRTLALPAIATTIVTALALACFQAKHHHGCGGTRGDGVVIVIILSIVIVIIIECGGPRGMRHKRHILF